MEPLSQIVVIAKQIRRDIAKLLDHKKDAQSEDAHAGDDQSKPKQTIDVQVRSEIQIPGAVTKKYESGQNKSYRLQWTAFIVNTLTLVVLCVYAAYTIKIYCANKKAAQAAQDTFGQIQQQTTLMRQQLVGSQGAVLDLGIAENSLPGDFFVQVTNSGHVTATDVHLKVDASQQVLKDGTLIGEPFHFELSVPPIAAGRNWNHTWHQPWSLTEYERQQGGHWAPDWPGKRTFVFRAEITYQNGFGDQVPTQRLCKQWLPGFSIDNKGLHFGATSGLSQ
ncbi:MAG: hypothetical protein WCF26_18035 [Candidatus Sulfotelmatobacter sp.]